MLKKYFINCRKWILNNNKKYKKITSNNFDEKFINKNIKLNSESKILIEGTNTNIYSNNKKKFSYSFT